MICSVCAAVTPRAAARLLLSGEIDLTEQWPDRTAGAVLEQLLLLPAAELLWMVDRSPYGAVADVKDIPQFGRLETLERVPDYFAETGQSCVDYAQLGFFLKKDVEAKLQANVKFGENHGKGAALLGLVNCVSARFVPSALSKAFCALPPDQRDAVTCRLLFRIPIVQTVLKAAGEGAVNGFSPMVQLSRSTMRRRGQSMRTIFEAMERIEDIGLSARLRRIYWDEDEVEADAEIRN